MVSHTVKRKSESRPVIQTSNRGTHRCPTYCPSVFPHSMVRMWFLQPLRVVSWHQLAYKHAIATCSRMECDRSRKSRRKSAVAEKRRIWRSTRVWPASPGLLLRMQVQFFCFPPDKLITFASTYLGWLRFRRALHLYTLRRPACVRHKWREKKN